MSTPGKTQKGTTGWGSFLSGAVAGLESRLDTILGEDDQASARLRAAEEAAKQTRQGAVRSESTASRNTSKTRANDRLQERLAKAMAEKSLRRPSSEFPSRTGSPTPDVEAVRNMDVTSAPKNLSADDSTFSTDSPKGYQVGDAPGSDTQTTITDVAVVSSDSLANPMLAEVVQVEELGSRGSQESDCSLKVESVSNTPPPSAPSSLPKPDDLVTTSEVLPTGTASDYQATLDGYLERIDALHAKITYLANSASAAAKEAAQSADAGSMKQKMAEKDEKISELIKEGTALSGKEVKAMTAVKTLRDRLRVTEVARNELKSSLEKSQKTSMETKEQLTRLEARQRLTDEQLKSISNLQRDLDNMRLEKTNNLALIAELRKQITAIEQSADDNNAREQAEQLRDQAKILAGLNEDLASLRDEKRLAEDKAQKELKEARQELKTSLERSMEKELDLKDEIQTLESRLEILRTQSEIQVVDNPAVDQSKLLRQIETLQSQYTHAAQNWQGIEAGMNSRITTLETDRDDLSKREVESRKRAREASNRARKAEEELANIQGALSNLEVENRRLQTSLNEVRARAEAAEKSETLAKQDLDRERKIFEESLQVRIDEEKARLRLELASPTRLSSVPPSEAAGHHHLHVDHASGLNSSRKFLAHDVPGSSGRKNTSIAGSRAYGFPDLSSLFVDTLVRPGSRRSSNFTPTSNQASFPVRTPTESINLSRHASTTSLPRVNGTLPSIAPSIDMDEESGDRTEAGSASPQRTVNDLMSVSTVGAGPSVQLVSRMSAAVRRLESEKAASKEELSRLTAQRDEAREEVVNLMRQVDSLQGTTVKVVNIESELIEVKQRYETALELVGEKTEEVEELRNDMADLKAMYKELVDRTMK